MPKYEFIVSVRYVKNVVVEADNMEDAHDLACETKDLDIVDECNSEFECSFNGEAVETIDTNFFNKMIDDFFKGQTT